MGRTSKEKELADLLRDALNTLRWIEDRIEEEKDKAITGKRANWRAAAIESCEESYGTLGRITESLEIMKVLTRSN